MLFDKSLRNKDKSVKSACGKKKSVKAAESYGWVVEDYEAWDAYDFAIESGWWDEAQLDADIVRTLSTEELASSLAYIFRMNEFREWDERNSEDDDEDEDIEESVRAKRKRAVKASKRRVIAANNRNVSASKIKKFIEDSVNDLQNSEYTNSRLILDEDLCLYVGYSDGFDTEDGYAICAKIAERNDGDWADFDYLNMPWNTYSDNDGSTGVFEGDVYDTDIEIIPGEDYTQDAQWLADSYATIRNLLDEGKLTIDASCGKKSVKASKLRRDRNRKAVTAAKLTVSFDEFKPWSGAVDTWNTLMDYDKIDLLEQILDDTYYDESAGEAILSETELNDLLWFEPETVYEWVGLYYNDETGEVSDEPFDSDDDDEEEFEEE